MAAERTDTARSPDEPAARAEAGVAAVRPSLLGRPWDTFRAEASAFLAESGEARFRLKQLATWLWRKDAAEFSDLSDLPAALRRRLAERFTLHPLELATHDASRDGTRKLLWHRRQGPGTIESVMIPERDRTTYCISSQAGCPVKCPFCATGYGGFQGQLSPEEIVDQVLRMRAELGRPPTNIVFMGMGEPLLNFEPVLDALRVLTHPEQLGLGARRITVSTVGIPERIRELSRRFPQVKIALSLHAARDELRDELVPLNQRYPLREVLDALREATSRTRKLVTLEYVVLPGVNDRRRDVDELVRVLRGLPSRINLIGFNPFPGAPYERPPLRRLTAFRERLAARFPGPVTLRRPRGDDIQGACGQLRLREAGRS